MFHKKNIIFFAFMLCCIKNYSAQDQPYTTELTCFQDGQYFTVVSCLHNRTPSIAFDDQLLFLAVLDNNIKLLMRCTQTPGSLTAIARDGKSVLHYAVLAEQPNNDLIKFFLQKNVNIDKQDDDGNTALHLAVLYNRDQTVKLLLENNAQSVQNNYGLTPLHLAILPFQPRYGIINQLTKNKVAFRTIENNGLTPLFLAICRHNLHSVKILLTAEPDITLHQHSDRNVFNFIDQHLNKERNIDKKGKIETIKDYITMIVNQTP